ncbi:MAG: hypothetical protein PHP50_00860 [Lachnospiraceae bacterium]|nr:hypothetical protein [Lachnospiraceae bacterium]
MEDGSQRIFLNTKGQNAADVPSELVHFLHYVENSSDETVENEPDDIVNRIHARVKKLKESRELEAGYMRFEELMQQRENVGRTEGRMESILMLLERKGEIPEKLRSSILAQSDESVLRKWLEIAADVNGIDEFCSKM